MHHDTEFLVYSKGKNLLLYSLEITEDIDNFIKPIYFSRDHNRNPAKILKEKDKLCSKIKSLMKLYKTKKSKKILIRIRKMMYKSFDNPVLLSYNNQFLTMYKTLIQDEEECERIDILKLHRTMVFNEIKFSNDMHKIRNIALPYNPKNNYLLLSIDGVIHKYDIATKEMLFSFKASAYRTMQIHDDDQKILTCDSSVVKIWKFEKDNPELVTSLPFEDKIERFFASNSGDYYVGLFQDQSGFKVYKQKLTEHWHCRERIIITSVDFTVDGEAFLAGTNEGKVHLYDLKGKKPIGDISIGRGKAIGFISVLDEKLSCIASEDPAVYITPLEQGVKDPFKLETNKSKVTCMKTSGDRRFIVIGFSDNTIEFWKYFPEKADFTLLKEIKEDFQLFDIDPLCSSMLILNPRCRDISFHLIEWEWDTATIDEDLQNINLDFDALKEDDLLSQVSPEEIKVGKGKSKVGSAKPKVDISDGEGKKRSQTAC